MILVTLGRRRGGYDRCPEQTLTFDDPLEALDHLVSAELAYGGQITCVTDWCVTVRTEVYGCQDTTVYTGPATQMRLLVDVATLTRVVDHQYHNTIMDAAVDMTDRLPRHMGRIPRMLSLVAPLVFGEARLRMLVMLASGIGRDDLEAGTRHSVSDLIAALQLARDGSCTFREALAL